MITFATQAAFDKAVQDSIAKNMRLEVVMNTSNYGGALPEDVVNVVGISVKNAATGVNVLQGVGVAQ